MLKSKLDSKKYPCIDFKDLKLYLIFSPGVDPKLIDPVLLGRIASLVIYERKRQKNPTLKAIIYSGGRTHETQIRLYINDGGHKNADGIYEGGHGNVARPGTSRHEFYLAIDAGSLWLKALNKIEASKKQKILNLHGLHKPLTLGNKSNICEDWHIEPIETYGVRYTADAMSRIAPTEVKDGH